MKFFSDKTTYEEIEIMAAQSMVIASAKNKIDRFVGNNDNMEAYDMAKEAERIRRAEIGFARKEGRDEGWKEGRDDGLKEGRDDGLKEGRDETKREIVINMLNDNLSIESIVKYSGLSEDKINGAPRG